MDVKVATSSVLSANTVSAALSAFLPRKLSAEYDARARYCSVLARALNVSVCARPNIFAREISKMPRGLAAIRVLLGLHGSELGGGLLGQGFAICRISKPNPYPMVYRPPSRTSTTITFCGSVPVGF